MKRTPFPVGLSAVPGVGETPPEVPALTKQVCQSKIGALTKQDCGENVQFARPPKPLKSRARSGGGGGDGAWRLGGLTREEILARAVESWRTKNAQILAALKAGHVDRGGIADAPRWGSAEPIGALTKQDGGGNVHLGHALTPPQKPNVGGFPKIPQAHRACAVCWDFGLYTIRLGSASTCDQCGQPWRAAG